MSVGDKIRSERQYRSLSQKQLAEKAGMSEPAIRNYELGNRTPSNLQIEKIANVLDISPLALSDPDLDSYYGIMHAFFYLENMMELHPVEIEGQLYLSIPPRSKNSQSTYEHLSEWFKAYSNFTNGEMSEEEYKEWKDTFPEKIAFNRK